MYSDLIKHRAIIHYKYFLKSLRRVSKIYHISKSTLSRWLQQDGVKLKPKKRHSIVDTLKDFVSAKLQANPFMTSAELASLTKAELNRTVSKSSVWKCIKSTNLTYKRSKPYVSKPSVIKAEKQFLTQYNNEVISVDETFFYLYDYPKYGYSPKGTLLRRPYAHTPRKRKITLYMAISNGNVIVIN